MLILGLTGSIGMGKSTVAKHFRSRGIAVFDADAEVHRLYENEAIPLIEEAFPGTTNSQGVDRVKLGAVLEGEVLAFAKLEALIHPLVLKGQGKFLEYEYERGSEIVVLEIPLLYETGGEEKVDFVIVVSADAEQQRMRVLARPNMSADKFEHILSRQLADDEKRRRANYVVDTSGTIDDTYLQVDMIIAKLKGETGLVYKSFWRKG